VSGTKKPTKRKKLTRAVRDAIQLRKPTPREREFIQMWEIIYDHKERVKRRDERIKNLLALLARERACRVHIGKHRKSAEHASD
jgi:hypothetical protein